MPLVGPSSIDISSELEKGVSQNTFVVNIGCNDGKSANDPCYPYFLKGHPGLAIDGKEWPGIHKNLPFEGVKKLLNHFLTPENVAAVLQENGCPLEPHMIKIDVDGIDGQLMSSILVAGFRPDLFLIEIQPEIPPPIVFSVMSHPAFKSRFGRGGFYGISISAVEVIARTFGYTPVSLDMTISPEGHDILCLRNDLLGRTSFASLDTRAAYALAGCHHFRFNRSGVVSQGWQNRQDWNVLLNEIFQACVVASQAEFGRVLPFELGLDWQKVRG